MAYGSFADDVAAELAKLRDLGKAIQSGADSVGTAAVQTTNAVSGAIAGAAYGAKAGAAAPTRPLPTWVLPTALGVGALLLVRKR